MPPDLDAQAGDADTPLVVRFAALGDVVLLTVLLQALAERYGRPVKVLGAGPWTAELLAHDPAVAELRLVASRRAPYWLTPSRWAARAWLRAHRGPIYLCERDVHGERVIAEAGVPEGQLVRAWQHWPGEAIHWADWWLQIAALDAPDRPGPTRPITTPPLPRLHAPAAWHVDAAQWIARHGLAGRPLVLLQPGHKKTHKRGRLATAGHDKHWPAERWGAVMRAIAAHLPEVAILVCGSPREAALAGEVVDAAGPLDLGGRAVNAAALELSLPRLVALAARAHSMVSVDTGPAHVAAAMDCPSVILYGRFGWGRWKARAPHADVIALGRRDPADHARVLDIGVDEVVAAWRSLAPRPTPR